MKKFIILLLDGQYVNRVWRFLLGDVTDWRCWMFEEVPAQGKTAWLVDVDSAAFSSLVLPGIAVDDDNTSRICLHIRWDFCCRFARVNLQWGQLHHHSPSPSDMIWYRVFTDVNESTWYLFVEILRTSGDTSVDWDEVPPFLHVISLLTVGLKESLPGTGRACEVAGVLRFWPRLRIPKFWVWRDGLKVDKMVFSEYKLPGTGSSTGSLEDCLFSVTDMLILAQNTRRAGHTVRQPWNEPMWTRYTKQIEKIQMTDLTISEDTSGFSLDGKLTGIPRFSGFW